MKQKVRVNISVDKDAKEKATKVFEEFGYNFSIGVNIFLRCVARTGSLPFELHVEDVYNQETLNALAECDEMQKNPQEYKRYSSVEEMMKDIDAEDNEKSQLQKGHRTSKKTKS